MFAHTGSHGVIIRNLNYDAGAVKAGSTVTDNVQIINLSSQPVQIDAQPGCGCTAASVPDKLLAPMHSEVIRLEVDTMGMKDGQQERNVMLQMQSDIKIWQQMITINLLLHEK